MSELAPLIECGVGVRGVVDAEPRPLLGMVNPKGVVRARAKLTREVL